MNMLKKLMKDESGATAIEYGLIVALIAIAVIVAVDQVGTNLSNNYDKVAEELDTDGTGGN